MYLIIQSAIAAATLRGHFAPSSVKGGGSYYVESAATGEVLMRGADIAVFMRGAWRVAGTSLHLVSASNTSGTDPHFGSYTGTRAGWALTEAPGVGSSSAVFETSLRNYESGVHFETSYPLGAEGTNHSVSSAHGVVIANWPAMRSLSPKLSSGGTLSWAGQFITPSRSRTYGLSGGPTVFFDDPRAGAAGYVLMGTPLDHFKVTGETNLLWNGEPGAWVPGTSATVRSLAANFKHRFELRLAPLGAGVTQAVYAWGQAMLAFADAKPKVDDVTIAKLSYTTDNGAQLCFCTEDCDSKLLEVVAGLEAHDAPQLGSISWQGGWWKNPEIHTASCAPWCVSTWDANVTKNPMGVAKLDAALHGLPLQLYAPYFCDDTSYDKEHGGEYTFVKADTTIAGCSGYNFRTPSPDDAKHFYMFFLESGKARGMTSFEPDFLVENFNCVHEYRSNVTASTMWLDAIDAAAMEHNLAVQLCMASPTDLLHSMSLKSVTNFRASTDYYYGRSWDLGHSSLLIWALGASPSKDTFWTTDNGDTATTQGGCPAKTAGGDGGCPDDHTNPGSELHTIIATLSKGPVGFSDAVNRSNITLLRRTCRDDGVLLQPSKPLTAIDAMLLGSGRSGEENENENEKDVSSKAPQGHVLSTFCGAPSTRTTQENSFQMNSPTTAVAEPVWSHHVLDHQLTADYRLVASDLWPPLQLASATTTTTTSTMAVAPNLAFRGHEITSCKDGVSAAACGITFVQIKVTPGGQSEITTLKALPSNVDKYTPRLTTIVPMCSTWAFFGEIAKFSTHSPDRFVAIDCNTTDGYTFEVRGFAGEEVTVIAAQWISSSGDGIVHTVTVKVGASGKGKGGFPA